MTLSNEWQVNCTNERERNKHLLKYGDLSDVNLLVGIGEQQISIRAHKLQLAKASPVFDELCNKHQNNTILIPNYEPDTINAMMQYIYLGEIQIQSVEMAFKLAQVANAYLLIHLAEACSKYIRLHMTIKDVCKIYEFGKGYLDSELKDEAMEMIRNNTKTILEADNIVHVNINTIIDIFDQEQLNIESELDLFNAILIYSKAHPSEPLIHDAIKKIRFLTMTAEDFTDGPGNSELLTDKEFRIILKNLSSPKFDKQMPDNFSALKNNRNNIKLYCTRYSDRETERDMESSCILSFKVDQPITLMGIKIPTKAGIDGETYEETVEHVVNCKTDVNILMFHIVRQRVPYNSLHEVIFDKPYSIKENQENDIIVRLPNSGLYPVSQSASIAVRVGKNNFQFERESSVHSGFIRSLVFKEKDINL